MILLEIHRPWDDVLMSSKMTINDQYFITDVDYQAQVDKKSV